MTTRLRQPKLVKAADATAATPVLPSGS